MLRCDVVWCDVVWCWPGELRARKTVPNPSLHDSMARQDLHLGYSKFGPTRLCDVEAPAQVRLLKQPGVWVKPRQHGGVVHNHCGLRREGSRR